MSRRGEYLFSCRSPSISLYCAVGLITRLPTNIRHAFFLFSIITSTKLSLKYSPDNLHTIGNISPIPSWCLSDLETPSVDRRISSQFFSTTTKKERKKRNGKVIVKDVTRVGRKRSELGGIGWNEDVGSSWKRIGRISQEERERETHWHPRRLRTAPPATSHASRTIHQSFLFFLIDKFKSNTIAQWHRLCF